MFRDISKFKKVYQPGTNTVKEEMGGLFTDCHGSVTRWSNRFSQPLDVLGVNDFRNTEVHTTEPIGTELIAFGFEMATEKLKGRKSPDIDHIPAELFKTWGKTTSSVIHKLIHVYTG